MKIYCRWYVLIVLWIFFISRLIFIIDHSITIAIWIICVVNDKLQMIKYVRYSFLYFSLFFDTRIIHFSIPESFLLTTCIFQYILC